MVWELFKTLKDSKARIPIIGIGGISCTNDALEFLMAGAAAIQVGSATFVNPNAMTEIINGIRCYLVENKMTNISQISIRLEKD